MSLSLIWNLTVVLLLAAAIAVLMGLKRIVVRSLLGLALIVGGFYNFWASDWREEMTFAEEHALDAAQAANLRLHPSEVEFLDQRDYAFDNSGPLLPVERLQEEAQAAADQAPITSPADRIAADSALVTMYSTMVQESLIEAGVSLTVVGVGFGLLLLQPLRDPPEAGVRRRPSRA